MLRALPTGAGFFGQIDGYQLISRRVSHRSGNKPMTDHKVVLITGVSSGIGRATAELLTSRGYRVFGTARNPDTVVPLQGVELLPLDVRDDGSVQAGVETALSRGGRIDVLVNNAGYTVVGAIEETSPSEAQALFDTNVFGVLRMVRAVLPAMRRQGSGTIVNTSSVLGFLPGRVGGNRPADLAPSNQNQVLKAPAHANSSSSALASLRSAVSKPSVNQP
jgi:NAD(P)-dependent dehydrogenase (short-subunit alcohol dehydrogenase family)